MTLSWVFAEVSAVTNGIPSASERMWIFEPFLPRSTGLGPVREPPFRPHVRGVEDRGGPVQVPTGAEPIEDAPVQFVEYPGCRPGGEATMCGRDADSERRWQVPPCAPAGEHVDDRGEHGPIIDRGPAAALWPGREAR